MCGIAGIWGQSQDGVINRMVAAFAHRGPDDEFCVTGEDFALGTRRLSIVDVAGGRQPLSNEAATIWACQNGELYNAPQVQPRLRTNGHIFRTTCDTEILPHLYEMYGVDFVQHIDGMFALAVWDDSEKLGVLARDRMGKKPLYYAKHEGALYFASEMKSLLCIPGFQRQLNLTALHHYLSYKHVPHPFSIFEGISILPPAHRLIYRLGETPRVERYWDVNFAEDENLAKLAEEELVEELLRLLREGVQRRLMSDVPIGFFLSGGIDSSLSTVLAAELCPDQIKTFTLTYGGDSTSEGKELDRHWAKWVAEKYHTEHHEAQIEFRAFPESIGKILSHFDEPFAGVVSTFYLSEYISQHVKVALAGDGADELFGSYRSHRLAYPLAQFAEYQQTNNAALIRPFENEMETLAAFSTLPDWEWRSKLLVFNDEDKRALYHPDIAAQIKVSTEDHLRQCFAHLTANDPLNRILEAEFRTIFPDQVMTFVDRLSMAHSLEVRTAYLDTAFVEFVARLPGKLKIRDGETKYILKKAALRYFPAEMVSRPKEGFLMPITQWLLNDLEDYVRQTLDPSALSKHGLFNAAAIQRLVDDLYSHPSPHFTQANQVLAFVIFQEWYNIYLS